MTTTMLADVDAAFQETLHMPDLEALHVMLGTVAANRMTGDPVWLFLIGPSASAKTETAETLADLPETMSLSTTTKAGLISGSIGQGGTGGVLFEGGDRFLLVIKDFTTICSEHASTRTEVLAILREMFDGRVERAVGSGGGNRIKWRGHVGCIACATEAIDTVDMANFGERWIRYRLPAHGDDDRFLTGMVALGNVGLQRKQRTRRLAAVTAFFRDLALPEQPPAMLPGDQDRLILLADLGARCRSGVVRGGGHGDEILQVPQPEEVPRLAGELGQLSAGLAAIGVDDEERWRLLVKCALDGMSSMRRQVIDVLLAAGGDYRTMTVAARCRVPGTSVRRHLQDLDALGLVDLTGTEPETWRASTWLRARWSEVLHPREIDTRVVPQVQPTDRERGADADAIAGRLAILDVDGCEQLEVRFAERWPSDRALHLGPMGWAADVRRWRREVLEWVGQELDRIEQAR